MNKYMIDIHSPVHLNFTGKFESPSPKWIHLTRSLADYELIVVTFGTLYITSDQQYFAISKGDYLLLPPHAHQSGYNPSDCSFYWMHFLANSEQEIPSPYADSPSVDPMETDKILLPETGHLHSPEKIIVLMKQLQDSIRSYNVTSLNNYLTTTILCELFSQSSYVSSSQKKKHKKQQLYSDIIDYIRRHIELPILVSDIAKYFSYNEKYLTTSFKKLSGTSLKQYILQQKMEHAKFLLVDTNDSIQEVAYQIGYKDAHVFMKSFKQKVGLTPSEYRNAYSKRILYNK